MPTHSTVKGPLWVLTLFLVLLLVSTDKKTDAISAFIEKMPRLKRLSTSTVILRDPGGRIAKTLGTRKYPETYFITPGGQWGGRVVGARGAGPPAPVPPAPGG